MAGNRSGKSSNVVIDDIADIFIDKLPVIDEIFEIIGVLNDSVKEKEKLKQERARRIENATIEAKNLLITASDFSEIPERRLDAEKQAIDRIEEALALKMEEIAPTLVRERRQSRELADFENDTGQNPRNVSLKELSPIVRGVREANSRIQNELAEPLAIIAALGEAAAFLKEARPSDAKPQVDLAGRDTLIPDDRVSQSDVDDDRVIKQIENTNRRIELLKDQDETLADSAGKSTAQKEKELDLLLREKDCQERLNKILQDNATLREQTENQTQNTIENEAAHENLASAIESSGNATVKLQDDLAALNAALATNADVNSDVVDGLHRELDVRQLVNDALTERMRLEEEQSQRLIKAEEDMKRRAEAVEDVFGDIRDAAKDSIRDVIKGTESIGDAFQKLADRITDILLDLALEELLSGGTGFSDVFGSILGGVGGIFGGGGGIPLLGTAANPTPLFEFHRGGDVPRSSRRTPGLRSDEVLSVLEAGERVQSRSQVANENRAANSSGGASGGVVVHNHFPNARNTDEARQAGSEIAAKTAAAAQRGMMRKGIG